MNEIEWFCFIGVGWFGLVELLWVMGRTAPNAPQQRKQTQHQTNKADQRERSED